MLVATLHGQPEYTTSVIREDGCTSFGLKGKSGQSGQVIR